MDPPDLVLTGERAALGPLRRDLAARYARWVNDVDTGRTLGFAGVATPASEEAYVDEAVKDMGGAHPRAAHFTIYDLADGEPVGTCGLMGIEWPAGPRGSASSSASASGAAAGSAPRRRASRSSGPSPGSACTTCSCRSCRRTRPPSAPTSAPASGRSGGAAAPRGP